MFSLFPFAAFTVLECDTTNIMQSIRIIFDKPWKQVVWMCVAWQLASVHYGASTAARFTRCFRLISGAIDKLFYLR